MRQPAVKPTPDSRCASLTSSWRALEAQCRPVLRAKAGGLAIAHVWSMARDAPCPIPLFYRAPSAADGAATWVRLSRGATAGAVPRRHGTAPEAGVAPLFPHDRAQVQAVHPTRQAGDVLVAERGLCSYAHLVLRIQANRQAVLRVGAQQSMDCTPGRPVVTPDDRLPEPQGQRCVRIPSH